MGWFDKFRDALDKLVPESVKDVYDDIEDSVKDTVSDTGDYLMDRYKDIEDTVSETYSDAEDYVTDFIDDSYDYFEDDLGVDLSALAGAALMFTPVGGLVGGLIGSGLGSLGVSSGLASTIGATLGSAATTGAQIGVGTGLVNQAYLYASTDGQSGFDINAAGDAGLRGAGASMALAYPMDFIAGAVQKGSNAFGSSTNEFLSARGAPTAGQGAEKFFGLNQGMVDGAVSYNPGLGFRSATKFIDGVQMNLIGEYATTGKMTGSNAIQAGITNMFIPGEMTKGQTAFSGTRFGFSGGGGFLGLDIPGASGMTFSPTNILGQANLNLGMFEEDYGKFVDNQLAGLGSMGPVGPGGYFMPDELGVGNYGGDSGRYNIGSGTPAGLGIGELTGGGQLGIGAGSQIAGTEGAASLTGGGSRSKSAGASQAKMTNPEAQFVDVGGGSFGSPGSGGVFGGLDDLNKGDAFIDATSIIDQYAQRGLGAMVGAKS